MASSAGTAAMVGPVARAAAWAVRAAPAAMAVTAGQAPQPIFEELYVSILDLQAAITPGVNWLADPWLFQYLTHTLDKRMMAMLTKNGPPRDRPFSINLNVSSVLSPEFRRFDEIVLPQVRGRPMIEFSKLDVFADMGAFVFARDFLHERGYRVCLDGLTHLTLPYCNRARLGFDLIKIFWRPEGIEDMQAEMLPAVRDIVMEAGQARVILCRCENARALEIGSSLEAPPPAAWASSAWASTVRASFRLKA